MTETAFLQLIAILVLGVLAQWLAWRVHLPSILLLLLFGAAAGPFTGLLHPDALFGDLLVPLVSISVAVILFEGGLSLNVRELRTIGRVVLTLVTLGAMVTWAVSALSARVLVGLDLKLAILLGAILVVTGPTVVLPLLRYIRPSRPLSSILKWEGIVIDPIGALLAVLVFEAILAGGGGGTGAVILVHLTLTILVGAVVGALTAGVLLVFLTRHWIPDSLQNPASLMLVVASYFVANSLQEESGLIAVTLMGVVLASQRKANVRHIVEFKENLRTLLISSLFIILAARLEVTDLEVINDRSLLFLAVLVLLARPLSVIFSTLGSDLNWRQLTFLSWLAPRGIVAAAVASVFSLRLAERGYPQAETLVPLTFMVIIGTVAIYGLSAGPLARRLQVAHPNPQGVVILGAHSWAREIAKALKTQGIPVLIADSNWSNVADARMEELPAYYGNVLTEYALDEMELEGIGRFLALTSNDEVNALAALRFAEVFGRSEVYQLPTVEAEDHPEELPSHLRGRILFGPQFTYTAVNARVARGAVVKATELTEEFNYDAFQSLYGERALPLFLIKEDGRLLVFTTEKKPEPEPGDTVISLVEQSSVEEPR